MELDYMQDELVPADAKLDLNPPSRDPDDHPGMTYRLLSYLVGTAFAVTSYMLGVWAYSTEAAALGQRPLPSIWLQVQNILPRHPFTFIAWVLLVAGFSVIVGFLFDREVYHRRRAENRANVDGLTGVYNHRYFQDRLQTEMERAQRYSRNLSLIMMDLDDFKQFNDRSGHQEGDRLLARFAQVCRSGIRSMDVLARYGGEEFVVILPEVDVAEATVVSDRIRATLESLAATEFPESPHVTVSCGVASYPLHGQTRHTLILNADTALYAAKRAGKNRTSVYEENLKRIYRASAKRLQALLSDNNMGAIEALSAAVDAKDHYTRGHSDAVTRYSCALAKSLGLDAKEQEKVKAAALLHDIGKIGTPDSILRKCGPLKLEEWQIVEDHPNVGSEILEKVQQLNAIIPAVRHHHERFDGLGYPDGLSGKHIPLMARIIALADAFDAMISDRTYRKALPIEDALEEIRRCAGTQFDPELVEQFINTVASPEQQATVDQAEQEIERRKAA